MKAQVDTKAGASGDSPTTGLAGPSVDLAGRGRRLFEFLARAQMLKTSTPRTIDAYVRDGSVLWMGELPDHAAVTSAHRTAEPEAEQPLLTVDRMPAPVPAPLILPSLALWLDDQGEDENREPQLQESIPNPGMVSDDGSDAHLTIEDHPDVRDAFRLWQPQWAAWAEKERADRAVRDLYAGLFATYVKVTNHPEELELILGIGCLAWMPPGYQPVRRHLMTSPASIAFDDDTGTITVSAQPALETLAVELDMLDPSLVQNPAHVNEIRTGAREFEHHPMHRVATGDLIRRLINSLHADSAYRDEDVVPDYGPTPVSSFAPALVMRKRSQMGLVDIFNIIAAQITETGEVPSGLLPLLDPDHQPIVEPDTSEGALVVVDDDVFLPMPLNQVQLDIVRRVDRHAQTLVQGPPGTGKTHTAAALLTHLLAQGKRVLVTAHTDRALKEVRGKLPESIKPLAVSVVGTSRSDMADLKVAVERISTRASDHDTVQAQATITASLATIDRLRRERGEIRGKLVEARRVEVSHYEHAGYQGTLARIAQDYQAEAEKYEWIARLITSNDDTPAPLNREESTRWLGLLRDVELIADEAEANQRLVALADIPTPEGFASQVNAEAAGEQGAKRHASVSAHAAFATISALALDVRSAIQARMKELARRADEFEQRHEPWMNAALRDIRAGRGATWAARATHIRDLIRTTRPVVESLGLATEIAIDATADRAGLASIAQHLYIHVSATGPVKTNPDGSAKVGAFANKAIKQAQPLFDHVRVNGQAPTTAERLAAVLAHLTAERQLTALDKAWPVDVSIPPEDTLWERLQWHATELEQLDRLLTFGHDLSFEEQALAGVGLACPDWNDMTSVLTYSRLVDAAAAKDAFEAAARPLRLLETTIQAVSTWADAADTVHRLDLAIRTRNRDEYAAAYHRLARLYSVRDIAGERDALTSQLRRAAPDLVEEVLSDPTAPAWDFRIPNLPQAWDWARSGAWILKQDTTDTNILQAQVDAIETSLRREIEIVAASRAWDHALSPTRLTGQSRADLTQYAQLVRRLGKGTGKYAVARRAEIRTAMDRCRPAVPVWIMPIYRIAEQLRIAQNMFDVIIVDEASQAGLEATFLQYLAPKIVIIGDDKQVSPAAVGIDQQQLRDLANLYLHDDRYKASWQDPKRSLFDEANMRFGSKLTLVEHRRCVPEIIGFSNRIAYEPDNIRLIPVRQYGADRLEPIKLVRVADGYEKGSPGNKINPPEIEAIVDQVEKCLSDPRYDDLTLGVISLQGQIQARRIEAALLERVAAEEWTVRELRCGDAADFQGSERDVIFLSMVSAPEPGQRLGALTAEMYMQRYNVAASRAKDQLWVFHSIDLDQLPNSEDMRHHLLDYCHGVIDRIRSGQGATVAAAVPDDVLVEPFDSLFEQRVYNRLIDRGYSVAPQFASLGYNLDLVVVGAKGRLAIECDGDAWHGPEAYERDLARQRDLERCGWQFFRIRESAYYVDQHAVLRRLWDTLDDLDIRPSGFLDEDLAENTENDGLDLGIAEFETSPPLDEDAADRHYADIDATGLFDPLHREGRQPDEFDTFVAPHEAALPSVAALLGNLETNDDGLPGLAATSGIPTANTPSQLPTYQQFIGELVRPLTATRAQLFDGLRGIVAAEGPVLGSRIHGAYVVASGGRRVGKQIARTLNTAITAAVRTGVFVADNPLGQPGVKPRTYRLPGQDAVVVRQLGPRTLEQVPPLELAHLLRDAAVVIGWDSTESLFREVLGRLGRGRLTTAAAETLMAVVPLAQSLDQDEPT